MTTSTDLLLGRRRELYNLIDVAIENYTSEIAQIDKMLKVAGITVPLSLGGNGADKGEPLEPRNIREQVLAILVDYPVGLSSRDIAKKVSTRFGRDIKSSNMSWHLSHMKKVSELLLEKKNWRISSDQDQLGLVDPEKEEANQAAE